MSGPSRSVALAAGGAPWETAVVREVEEADGLILVRRCMDVTELLAVTSAEVAVVDVLLSGLDVDAVASLLRRGVRVLGVAEPVGAGIEARAEELGISVVVAPGGVAAAVAASEHAVPDDLAALVEEPVAERGVTVAVWGPHGAPGRSTVALSVAAEIARRGRSVVLVDADVYGGSQAQQVALLDEASGLVAACREANRGGPIVVADHVVAVADHLDLLTGLPRADMWATVRPAALERVMDALRGAYSHVVVDCGSCLEGDETAGPGRNRATRRLLQTADEVIAVGRADPVGLARLVRGLHDLRPLIAAEPRVVLNQVRATLGWNRRELVQTVRRVGEAEPVALLPHDLGSLDPAMMAGELPHVVAPESAFVAEVGRLVDVVTKTAEQPAAQTH